MGVLSAFVLLSAAATSTAADVNFPIGVGEEVFEIHCPTNPARIREAKESIARQQLEIQRLQKIAQSNGLVEGENLLLLTLRFKIGFDAQNLAILEFGQYYCQNPRQITSLQELNIEDIIMRSAT
jgi:hypothetical protein